VSVNRLGVRADVPSELLTRTPESRPTERWTTLAAQPASLLGLENWGHALDEVRLSRRERAIASLAVSRRSSYEFRLQGGRALSAGLTSGEIQAIADEDWTDERWSEGERVLLRFSLMFDAGHGVGDSIVQQLRTHYESDQIVGLCQWCAHGGALARTAIALCIEPVAESVE